MFIIAYGDIVDGMTFVGPFLTHDDAVLHCEGDDTAWHIVPLIPPPDSTAGSLQSKLSEMGDQLDEVAVALAGPLIGPSEETSSYVSNLREIETFLRTGVVHE